MKFQSTHHEILIVDDHRVLATGIARYLDIHFPENKIIIASTGKECLAIMNAEDPDLVLLDIKLPDVNGIDLCHSILKAKPSVKIIALTGMPEKSSVRKMLEAGALGYILKTAIADELVEGIETVLKGKVFISKDLN